MAYFVDSTGQKVAADRRALRTTLMLRLPENTSPPTVLSDAYLASQGIHVATDEPRPAFNHLTHKATLSDRATEVDGVWARRWTVEELDEDAKEANREKARKKIKEKVKETADTRVVTDIMDIHGQLRTLTKAVLLIRRLLNDARGKSPLTQQIKDEFDALLDGMEGMFNSEFTPIRTAEETIKAAVDTMTDEELESESIEGRTEWPWYTPPEEML